MESVKTIVVAGYGSWIKARKNPASEVVKSLKAKQKTICNLVLIECPVVSDSLFDLVETTLRHYKPDAWIGLGVSEQSSGIQAEMVGINWRHFSVPDASGEALQFEPVVDGGPVAYNAMLPNQAIVEKLKEESIPASISFFAGTHLCNQMIYTVNYLAEQLDLGTLGGFLHVPQSVENALEVKDGEKIPPMMSVEMMTEAVEISIDCILEYLDKANTKRRSYANGEC